MKVALIRVDGTMGYLDVQPATSAPWSLQVSGEGLCDEIFLGETLFDALTELRKRFEVGGGRILCAGARRDVYPSSMARSMGSARKAYIMKIGQSANTIVDIFDPAIPEDIGTIRDQSLFREEWAESLRAKLS